MCLFGEIMVELILIDEFNFIKCKLYFASVLNSDEGRLRSVSSACTFGWWSVLMTDVNILTDRLM